jgi:hypothetical protein
MRLTKEQRQAMAEAGNVNDNDLKKLAGMNLDECSKALSQKVSGKRRKGQKEHSHYAF